MSLHIDKSRSSVSTQIGKFKTSSAHLPLPPLPSLSKVKFQAPKTAPLKPPLPVRPPHSVIRPYPEEFYPVISSSTPSKKVTKIGGVGIPKTEASEAEYDYFLFNTAAKIEGEHPLDATFIALGDHHTDKSQRIWRSVLINHYAKEGDIVLVEGVEAFRAISLKSQNKSLSFIAKKKIQCYGWDDPKQLAVGKEYLSRSLQIIDKYIKNDNITDIRLDKEDREMESDYMQNFERSSVARTVSMKRTARMFLRQLKPGQKVFLIAGSAHLKGVFTGMGLAKTSLIVPKIFDGEDSAQSTYEYIKSVIAD